MNSRLGKLINTLSWEEKIIRQAKNNKDSSSASLNNNSNYCHNESNIAVSSGLKHDSVSFKGGIGVINGVSQFIKWMEEGGKSVEFTVLDVFSMMLPRTFQAFNRNKEELGHPNYKAGTEEAIREFLTGPSMFVIPMFFLTHLEKLFGSASKIQFELMDKFTESFKELCKGRPTITPNATKEYANSVELREEFYKEMLNQAFEDHNLDSETIDKMVKNVIGIDNIKFSLKHDKNFQLSFSEKVVAGFQSKINSTIKLLNKSLYKNNPIKEIQYGKKHSSIIGQQNELAKLLSKIKKETIRLNKKLAGEEGFIDRLNSPQSIKLSKAAGDNKLKNKASIKFSMKISELVNNSIRYASDIVDKVSAQGESSDAVIKAIDNLHSVKRGGRTLFVSAAVATTALFLYYIPHLYKRNKQYPGIAGLVPEDTVNTPNTTPKILNPKITLPNIQPAMNNKGKGAV